MQVLKRQPRELGACVWYHSKEKKRVHLTKLSKKCCHYHVIGYEALKFCDDQHGTSTSTSRGHMCTTIEDANTGEGVTKIKLKTLINSLKLINIKYLP